ncbi:P-loop containing nucleoside triphosphate hydrolase protein [Thozetella sp. PMI_491]|nr:P-loop containing nucleoside triphosphate hydrolase protein [Thozetella sp. PMI_491]
MAFNWDASSPGLATQALAPHLAAAEVSSDSDIEWIEKAHQFARTGYLQAALGACAVLWTLTTAIRQRGYAARSIDAKPTKVPVIYEICAQGARASAFALLIVGASQDRSQSANACLVGYAFLLGLVSLENRSPNWRRLAARQVNFLLFASFLILLVAEVLPQLRLKVPYTANKMVMGAILSLAAAVLIAFITPRAWIPPSMELDVHPRAPEAQPSVEETCSLFNYYFTYEWLTPLIWKGFRRPIEMADLPSLPWYDEPLKLLSYIVKVRQEKKQKTLWTVFKFQRTELLTMAVWVALTFSVELIAPFALYQLLGYIGNPDEALLHPGIWLFLMFAGPMARTVCFQQYIFTSTRLIVRIKSGMTQELYHRALDSMELEEDVLNSIETKGGKKPGMKSTSTGRLSNLMASDVDAITNSRDIMQGVAGVPIGTALSLYGLYRILGWSSLVGTGFMILMTPVPAMLAQLMGNTQRNVKAAQDTRISLITEYLTSIKAIKYFAWEESMIKHIQEARAKEQKYLWHITLLITLMHVITELMPIIALVLIFSLYVGAMKQPLTAPIAFTTLSLILTMRRNISMVGWYTRSAVNGWISIDRLDRYFGSTTPLARYPVGPAQIKNATFRRHKNATFTLKDISLDFVEGGLNVITGPSGSGKTTLLLSLLGETIIEAGSVTKPDDVAYASQTAWLESDTIRENILFHSEFEEARYERVLEACSLGIDLEELPNGDQTEVGENGTALSGGQRARVALARALYSKAPLLLLDDTFSALDTKTASAVWKSCFCTDLLKGRTVILVTQMPWVSAQGDFAITLEDGVIKSAEQNIGVVRKPVALEQEETVEEVAAEISTPPNGANGNGSKPQPASAAAKEDDITKEMKASGGAARLGFFKYMLYFGSPLYAVFALLTSVIANIFLIATTYWLSIWVNAYTHQEAVDIAFYLGIYVAIVVGGVIFDGFSFLVYNNGGWIAAKRLHEACIRSVMYVPLSWWKNVPVGRVVNRFSRDMNSLDQSLARVLQAVLELVVMLFARLSAVSSIMPIFILPGIVTCFVGVVAGEMYTRTVVMIRRLVSSSQSPVFSQFSDSLAGLAVIRARSDMRRLFGDMLAERLRKFSQASEANYNANRWVALRVDFVAALVSLCAGIIAVSKAGLVPAGLVGFSLVNATGLSETILWMVRAGNELEVELQSFDRVKEYATIESEEEADKKDDTEALANHEEYIIPKNWPRSGAVEFRDATIRYQPDGPDILKDINLKFNAGERVAVVGRTGSGKSTLVLSMLHFTNIVKGKILYDGVDITAISRAKLREALTIIPQEATLFNGTVGSNLDPSGELPVERLKKAIESCANIASFQFHSRSENGSGQNGEADHSSAGEATPTEGTPLLQSSDANGTNGTISAVAEAASGLSLETTVQARGENFSHGQRQVLSLCRALVRRSKLMLLDEATASMDYETDRGIQKILREELDASNADTHGRTLVTIAHRLRTIFDYDKVVVLGAGKVIEVGSPTELYRAKGQFYEMVLHSGESDDLEQMLSSD